MVDELRSSAAKIAVFGAMLLPLAACSTMSTVTSVPVNGDLAGKLNGHPPVLMYNDGQSLAQPGELVSRPGLLAGKTALLHYAVAQTYFVVQVAKPATTSSTSTGASGAAGAGAAAAPPAGTTIVVKAGDSVPAAPAALPVSVTISAATGKDSAGAGAKASNPCDAWAKTYSDQQTATATQLATYLSLIADLHRLALTPINAGTTTADKATRTAQEAAFVKARDALADRLNVAAGQLNPAYISAYNDAITAFNQMQKTCPVSVSVSVQPVVQPDPHQSFALFANVADLYNDSHTFAVDSNGFLTNGAPTAAPQATTVLASLASTAGIALTLASGGAPAVIGAVDHSLLSQSETIVLAGPSPCQPILNPDDYFKGKSIADIVSELKICDTAENSRLRAAWLYAKFRASLGGEVDTATNPYYPGILATLPSDALPLTLYLPLAALDPDGTGDSAVPLAAGDGDTANQQVDNNALLMRAILKVSFGLDLQLSCGPHSGERPADHHEGAYTGLVVATSRPCQVFIMQSRPSLVPGADNMAVPLAMARYWVEDSRYLELLQTRRGYLASRNAAYTFNNGVPTGVTYTRNSETAAVVALPGAIIGGLVSGISSGVQGKTSIATANTSSLTAQTSELTAQTANLNAQAALATAQAAAAKAAKGPGD